MQNSCKFTFSITGSGIYDQISTHGQRTYSGSTISHQDLNQTADALVRSSLSQSTASAYKSVFLTYTRFVTQYFGTASHLLPPSLQHLSGFIAHCFLKELVDYQQLVPLFPRLASFFN